MNAYRNKGRGTPGERRAIKCRSRYRDRTSLPPVLRPASFSTSTQHPHFLTRRSASMARQPVTTRALQGSERQPLPEARAVGKADPEERLEVSVLLRRGNSAGLAEHVNKLAKREGVRRHLTREEFEGQFSADGADIATVKKFADAHGLAVVQEHAGRRTIVLSGTVAQF